MISKTNELIDKAYDIACAHGFHDIRWPDYHWLTLTIGEVSEMVDAHRRINRADIDAFNTRTNVHPDYKDRFNAYIKDTVEDEMADIAIRLYDFAGLLGVKFSDEELKSDMHDNFDKDFGNSSFIERAFFLIQLLSNPDMTIESLGANTFIRQILGYLECWADNAHIDLLWHIEHKMEYNKMRERRHNKAY